MDEWMDEGSGLDLCMGGTWENEKGTEEEEREREREGRIDVIGDQVRNVWECV